VITLETVVPIYYSMSLSRLLEGLALDVVTSPTFAMYGGSDQAQTDKLFAVSNTKIRGSYTVRDFVLVTAGVQIPTGGNKLSQDQMRTAGAISTKQMGFKVSRAGSGHPRRPAPRRYNVPPDVSRDRTKGLQLCGA